MVVEAPMAMFATRRPAVAGCRASGVARFWRSDVPAEVSELLVDALESHGCVCVCVVVGGVRVLVGQLGRECGCGVEELKWDVCSQQGQRLAWDPKESKCGGVSGQSQRKEHPPRPRPRQTYR
jgi:hypothetical protein